MTEPAGLETLILNIAGDLLDADPRQTDDAVNSALRRLGTFTATDRSYIFLFSATDDTMSNTHEWCRAGVRSERDHLQKVPLAEFPWFSERILRRETVHVPDVTDLPPEAGAERREFEAEKILSLLNVPIFHHNQVRGALGLDTVSAPKAWSPQQIALLKIVASMLGSAIERAQEARQLAGAKKFSDYLSDINSVIISSLPSEKILERVVGLARDAMECDTAILALRQEGQYVLSQVAGQSRLGLAPGESIPPAPAALLTAAAQGAFIVSVDVPRDERFAPGAARDFPRDFQIKALISVPLYVQDQITGVLTFSYAREKDFLEDELNFARKMGSSISLALESAQNRELLLKALTEARALGRVQTRMSESLDLDELLETALDEILAALSVNQGCVYLISDGELVMRAQRRLTRPYLDTQGVIALGEGCAGQAALTKEMFAPTAKEKEFVCRPSEKLLGVDCLTAIPIVSKGRALGVLELFAPVQRRLNERERLVVKAISGQMATAIENSRLFAVQKNIAETLQETLLTVPEKIAGIDFGHLYRASSNGEARAGGDFYDLFELEHGKIGLIVGDVSGKGLDAASLTGLVKNAIKAYSYQLEGPAEVMALTNKLVERMTASDVFVTAFFGVLDKENGALMYCNAGHPQPLIRRASGRTVSSLESAAPALGIFPELRYTDGTAKLDAHDLLFLYTDGVTETKRNAELFGTGRLMELLKILDFADPHDLPRLVVNELLRFGEGVLRDDIAILAVRRSS